MRSCRTVSCAGALVLSFFFFALCSILAIGTAIVGNGNSVIDNKVDIGVSAGAGGELVLTDGEPSTIDPALAMDSLSARYIAEIFSGLVTLNRKLEIVPDIAESWTISEDGKTYTFYLRKDVKFHDGRPVTAGDFKNSMERASNPATGSMVAETYLGDIVGAREVIEGEARSVSGIKVINDQTLEITIVSPKAHFLSKLTYPTAFVVDIENTNSGPDWVTKANGTGPFKIKEWNRGERLVLVKNESYHGGVPKLDRVVYQFHAGDPLTMYKSGEVDVAGVGTSNIDLVYDKASPLSKELVAVSELSVGYVAFDTSKPPFDDPRVRQAFSHAIDKDRLASVVLKNSVQKADGILPPGLPGFDPNLKGLSFDPALAKRLIAESKYGHPDNLPSVVLTTGPRGGAEGRLITAMADMWKTHLGVQVQIQQTDGDTFLRDLYRKKYQMYVTGWIADYPDPQNFLQLLFHSKSAENRGAYTNAELDRLLEKAELERRVEERIRLYQEAERIIVRDAAWIPLYFGKDHTVVKPYVRDFQPAPVVLPILKDVWLNKND